MRMCNLWYIFVMHCLIFVTFYLFSLFSFFPAGCCDL